MSQTQFLQITKAAPARVEFPIDGGIEPVVLMAEATKRTDQRHVVDDIDHLAIDRGGLVGKIVMQGFARCSQVEHRHHHGSRDRDHAERHRHADGSNQRDCRDGRDARRQHVPDEHVLDREHGIRGGGNAAGEHAGQPVQEVAGRVPGQMAEHVAPKVTGDADKGKARGPACDPPQKIIGSDQRHEENECQPYAACVRRNDSGQDHHMCGETLAQIPQHKGKGTVRIS